MITAEEARKISNKENEFKFTIDKVDKFIREEANHPKFGGKLNLVYPEDNKKEKDLELNEIFYDKKVVDRVIKELKANGFEVHLNRAPCFSSNRFEIGKLEYITIRW